MFGDFKNETENGRGLVVYRVVGFYNEIADWNSENDPGCPGCLWWKSSTNSEECSKSEAPMEDIQNLLYVLNSNKL